MPEDTRRLAAIMFIDMVGFTASAQTDESGALKRLEELEGLLRPLIGMYHGREIKGLGDGFLVEFDSALRATQCALEIQRSVHDRNSRPNVVSIQLRIGIHLGDVEQRGGDILGDAVNIASRVEPLADPGGVCITSQVFDQVQNKIPNRFESIGATRLKNVLSPVEVYKVVPPGTPPDAQTRSSTLQPRNRIAVLPLVNMSQDHQDDFFSDGLTEEIIAELAKVPGMRVIARTSIMRYRGSTKGISEIGKELKVGSVLEGSARRIGTRVRVTAQLIDAQSEEHLWSERYDRELTDIFAIQGEIAAKVAEALHVAIPAGPRKERETTPDLEAYKSYLMGRSLWSRRTPDAVRAALQCFEDALKLDPKYAKAYCGVADCYSILADRGQLPPREGQAQAMAAAQRALQLDESLPEAHASLGLVLQRDYDWKGADREFQRAIELNPMYSLAHFWRYMGLLDWGQIEEAGRELRKAEEADPLSPNLLIHVANLAWIQGRDQEALSTWKRAEELGGESSTVVVWKIALLTERSRQDEAMALLPKLHSVPPGYFGLSFPLIVHQLLGMRQEALRDLEALVTAARESYVPASQFAWAYGVMGEADRFFEWAFRSADERGPGPYVIISTPLFKTMREDPRFQEYLRRCNLVQ